MWRHISPAFKMMIVLTVLTGLIYPGVITGLCQIMFHHQANGSLVRANETLVGSSLIGQSFSRPEYFHPRPSAAGNGYDPMASGGSNLGPTSQALYNRVKASVAQFRRENPQFHGPIPADMVTASASGLDPDISPAGAYAQAQRVARTRGVAAERIRRLIREYTEHRQLGFLGDPRVNVLEINLALDRQFPRK
ncbi:MAG TPA: potassium-transporting ATPase subunit KdpC [Terriglobia bacterium]|nr:potassium-transporting ATPase subunit KdpC [Terriglobia bacterium]